MAKIHTHYDNLKVARMAPREVIRAAYKALSQKYHPDKNPGDEKAARIMAILNSAYDTLSDTQRRREHDEWIAAEEWEIDWLESTRNDDGRADKQRADGGWAAEAGAEPARARRAGMRWAWWTALAAGLALGWVAGVVTIDNNWLALAWNGKAASSAHAAAPQGGGDGTLAGAVPERWHERDGAGKPFYPEGAPSRAAPVKVVAMSQVVLPGVSAGADCGAAALPTAPNGEPWPAKSGYVDGFAVGNRGDDMQLMLDNAANASAVFIKVYDLDRSANVRYAYVQAHDKLLVDKLANGKYEIRYQNLDVGACASPAGSAGASQAAPADTGASANTNTESQPAGALDN